MEQKHLTVGGVKPQDAGQGVIRVGERAREKIGIEVDDIVKIEDEDTVAAIAKPAYPEERKDDREDEEETEGRSDGQEETEMEDGDEDTETEGEVIGRVRMDEETRANVGTKIGDKVEVTGCSDVKEAESVVVVSSSIFGFTEFNTSDEYLEKLIEIKLRGRPLLNEQKIRLDLADSSGQVEIHDMEPSGTALVTEETDVQWCSSSHQATDLTSSTDGVPDVEYDDIGGLQHELERVREMVEVPITDPESIEEMGIEPPKGVLLYGPPGTGKTLIAEAVANEVDANLHKIEGPEVLSKWYGETEENIRQIFDEAREDTPSIILIDEIDAIAPDRGGLGEGREAEKRMVDTLLTTMDGMGSDENVSVVATTNRPEDMDGALRRSGRLDKEVKIGVPDAEGRKEILDVHTENVPLEPEVNLTEYAERTHGFVGADLEALVKEAATAAIREKRYRKRASSGEVKKTDWSGEAIAERHFEAAMREVEPSSMRKQSINPPEVSYGDIGGAKEAKEKLTRMVEWPLKYPELLDVYGTETSPGILLYGPPGTGKTLLAKAVANSTQSNFISVDGPELLEDGIGESGERVNGIFEKAIENSPSIVFFDEIDSIASHRGESPGPIREVVSQLLTELDGLEALHGVKVIATANRPDMIDKALLRSGRIEESIEVPLPGEDTRERIFRIHTSDSPLGEDVDFGELASLTEGYTGSDIEAVCNEAARTAMGECIEAIDDVGEYTDEAAVPISMDMFLSAIEEVDPSLTERDIELYEELSEFLDNGKSEAGDEAAFV
jgi:transitional endoplasmic reticulum ATPase